MSAPSPEDGAARHAPALRTRSVELAMAALLLAVAVAVVADSWRVGARWADDGPQPGYFPFYVGLLLGAASLWTMATQLRRWAADRERGFVTAGQARDVAAVLLPMVLHVAAIKWLGLYVASALLIAWFMHRHGQHRAWVTALVSVGVPLLAWLVFERWFVVPLPKSVFDAWLGF
jgi:putative tricarboxylic transport membrane protein